MRHRMRLQPLAQDQQVGRHGAKCLRDDGTLATRGRHPHRGDHRLLMHVDPGTPLDQPIHRNRSLCGSEERGCTDSARRAHWQQ
jgi:hypothetical protein